MAFGRRRRIARILIVIAFTVAVVKELTNHIFQHHRGFRVLNRTAIFEDRRSQLRIFKTHVQCQILLAQQTGSTDAQRTGVRNMVKTRFDFQRHARQVRFRI
ncbi:hypothetical protein SDC9_173952 [bioreactor metagenome]|uniref:Uncharacterized protein n=1 Tax=bioreactor metagenome TaxID=1076179 RepID=A0A645GHV6_9ZZZZ